MKNVRLYLMMPAIVFLLLSCSRPTTNGPHNEPGNNHVDTIGQPDYGEEGNWNYTALYGQYLHESNSREFTAVLEIIPLGNDLSFTISLLHGSCEAGLDGTIGMVFHNGEEYAGFFDSEECRLAFNFFLLENRIRVDEIGVCRAHPLGCSFGGTYVKKKEP